MDINEVCQSLNIPKKFKEYGSGHHIRLAMSNDEMMKYAVYKQKLNNDLYIIFVRDDWHETQ